MSGRPRRPVSQTRQDPTAIPHTSTRGTRPRRKGDWCRPLSEQGARTPQLHAAREPAVPLRVGSVYDSQPCAGPRVGIFRVGSPRGILEVYLRGSHRGGGGDIASRHVSGQAPRAVLSWSDTRGQPEARGRALRGSSGCCLRRGKTHRIDLLADAVVVGVGVECGDDRGVEWV